MTAKAQKESLSMMLIGHWEQTGRKLADLAEAFPEEKLESAPAKSVRTAGDVLRHVAFWNRYVAGTVRGSKVDGDANELPKAEYATKARILDALRSSTADVVAALREREEELDPATAGMAVSFLEHTSEHYGQLAVYARLNGIVPPVSRG